MGAKLRAAVLLSGLAGSFTTSASATPIVHWKELLRGSPIAHSPAPLARPLPGASVSPLASTPFGSTQVTAIDTVLDIDPIGGQVSGTVKVTLQAKSSSVGLFHLLLDQGLSAVTATAPGNTVAVSAQPSFPYNYVTLTLGTPLAPSETLTVSVDYTGKLSCGGSAVDLGMCYLGKPLAYAYEGSALPLLMDQDGYGGWNVWGASRTLELTLPSGTGVVASGDLVDKTDDGQKAHSRWNIPAYTSMGANIVLMGDLASTTVSGTSLKSEIVAVAPASSWPAKMGSWMPSILSFLGASAGKELPYESLHVVSLPVGWSTIFRGSAGHAITLLSEDYAKPGDGYFEETLAHENAHQWWGVLVSPIDVKVTRWLTEGLATQAQIDYAAQKLPAADRDAYIARRYREHWLLVRHMGDATLPMVMASPIQVPTDTMVFTIWGYIRSSALLEHLRMVVGESTYANILKAWVSKCEKQICDTGDFQNVVNEVSGRDFTQFFAQWVYSGAAVEPFIGFEQSPTGGELTVTATGIDVGELPLELVIRLENGEIVKKSVTFTGAGAVKLDVPGPVRSVRPNPRHDGFVWSKSKIEGDVDFDAEVDGLDVIHCAWRFGKDSSIGQPEGEGIWNSDLDFDPRCDFDSDGSISSGDLSKVTGRFGTLRGAP